MNTQKLLLALILLLVSVSAFAAEQISIYYFKQSGCPNCAIMEAFLDDLIKDFPEIQIVPLNVSDKESIVKYNRAVKALQLTGSALPLVLIGEYYFTGARPSVLEQITFTVSAYRSKAYSDKMGLILAGNADSSLIAELSQPENDVLKLPILGRIDLGNLSLFVSTVIIAFVDGFNPCSLWVLTLVLGVALHSKSRKRVLAVGLCFLAVTSLVYGGFLFGAVKIVAILRFSLIFRLLLVIFTLVFALVNIKDYFRWKEGISFTISKGGKKTIAERLRAVFGKSNGFAGAMLGTFVLAAAAALIELPCTAGFPVLWAQLVNRLGSGAASLPLYMPVYLAVYLLDEIAVLIVAVIGLKRLTVDENKARALKLVGGSLMFSLSVHLLFFHSLLKSFAGIASVIVGTAVLAVILMLVRKKISRLRG